MNDIESTFTAILIVISYIVMLPVSIYLIAKRINEKEDAPYIDVNVNIKNESLDNKNKKD